MIVFDDANWPSVGKLIRYFRNYPAYQIVLPPGAESGSERLSFRQSALRILIGAAKLFPEKTRKELFSERVNSGLIRVPEMASMVGLKKVREDDRGWDWYQDFN